MATEQEQQELIETLKFTPRTYRLSLWGYGGEIAIGSLTKEQYEFWKDKDEADLINHCTDYEDEDSGIDIPEEAKFCTDGAWYETETHLDNMSGCEFSDHNHITILDENDEEVWNKNLGYGLEDEGVTIDSDEIMARDHDKVNYAFCFQSTEKGTFFDGDIYLKQPFDPKKLLITTIDFEGWELVAGVQYDGEEIDGWDGYDTTGKGYYANVFEA